MEKEQRNELVKILLSAVFLVILIIVEHSGIIPHSVVESRWFAIPFLLPLLLCGSEVIKGAFDGLRRHEMLDEEFLMTLAVAGAFFIGEYSEGAAVMVFYKLGEWFEDYAVDKSRDSISALLDIVPEHANIVREDGQVEEVDPDRVRPGDILVIRPGEKIPVDSTVIKGESLLNTAALTGESMPRAAKEGDLIFSGCINGEKALTVRAEKKYEDSTVARILELVENAAEKKSKTENFITRFARIYTPCVVAAAVALAVIPPFIGIGTVMEWIERACTFLVVSCPCALVISVPLSFFGGIGAASRQGVLVKGSNYLEVLAETDTLVTDKTGTLTKGVFRVTEVIPEGCSEEEVLEKASYAEYHSTHPIASSIREAYGLDIDVSKITEHENISGRGSSVMLGDGRVLAGNLALMEEQGIAAREQTHSAGTVVYVAYKGKYIGAIVIADSIKDTAKQAVKDMKEARIKRIVMLTGDRRRTAEEVAAELGIDEVYAELMPQDKVEIMEKISKEGGRTAFVGDGINDAPVLAGADLGIAMGSMGSDAAIEAADIVIMDDELGKIPKVKEIALKTIGIAKQNIVFALIVKFLILALGAAGIATMWAAVFADVGVAVLCVLNSMRMMK